jgi:hypothetical protein
MPAASSDADTIEAAYQDHVKTVFIGLCTSLEQGKSDQQSIEQFTTGYNIAKHARYLALGVVGAAAPQAKGMAMRKKSAKRA